MPMQKATTSSKKTDLNHKKLSTSIVSMMEPKPETLQKILSFAAAYRPLHIGQNQFIDLYLN
jgi:hypothetical protein